MITLNNVSKHFGDKRAVDGVYLTIEAGSFVGLLGPNGAGKTTIMKMISALIRPTQGEIFIDGERVSRNNDRIKSMLGIVPQITNLEKEMKVIEDLIFAGKIFKMPKKDYMRRIDELVELMELEEFINYKTETLSGGLKRRVMIAKALMHNPQIILLDEPTVGIDVAARIKIWDILKKMKHTGLTVLLTTHYIEEAEKLCDRVCFIDRGKIIEDDSPQGLIDKTGKYTVEVFDEERGTEYVFFGTREEANAFASGLVDKSVLIRELTLGDVFYSYTKRRVA